LKNLGKKSAADEIEGAKLPPIKRARGRNKVRRRKGKQKHLAKRKIGRGLSKKKIAGNVPSASWGEDWGYGEKNPARSFEAGKFISMGVNPRKKEVISSKKTHKREGLFKN